MINLPEIEQLKRITMMPGMKLIVMSDMHKGDGSGADDFAQNSLIYCCALQYYLKNGFTCIELGDAEELWESDNFDQIYITHTDTYDLLAKFHDPDPEKTSYLKVWGNHDLYWKDHLDIYQSIFPGIQIYALQRVRNLRQNLLCTELSIIHRRLMDERYPRIPQQTGYEFFHLSGRRFCDSIYAEE
jgi:hypothetical protein